MQLPYCEEEDSIEDLLEDSTPHLENSALTSQAPAHPTLISTELDPDRPYQMAHTLLESSTTPSSLVFPLMMVAPVIFVVPVVAIPPAAPFVTPQLQLFVPLAAISVPDIAHFSASLACLRAILVVETQQTWGAPPCIHLDDLISSTLMAFPVTLDEQDDMWFVSLTPGSITSFKQLADLFDARFDN
ncbi:hypothetical protein ACLOJK_013590 [Asimina triloba]